jgi:peptide/nickel transport system substrate-binding protein
MKKALQTLSLVLVLCLLVPAFAMAGGEKETTSGAAATTGALGGEAPELKAMVEAGQLPAVAERLPEDPFVVDVIDGIGQYGGKWRRAIRAASAWAFWGYVIKENEIRYDMDIEEIIPVIWKDF